MAFGNLWGLLMTLICFSHLPLNHIQNAPDLQKVATSWVLFVHIKRGIIFVHINTTKKKIYPTSENYNDTLTKKTTGLMVYF